MTPAANRRSELSRRHLRVRFRSVIEAWTAARRAGWSIDDSWSPERVTELLNNLRAGKVEWVVLTREAAAVREFDRSIEYELLPSSPARRYDTVLSVDDIFEKMRAEFPDITRERVRTLLFRAERSDEIGRKKRGVYSSMRYGWNFGDQRQDMLDEDEYVAEWPRIKRQWDRELEAMLIHILLPRLPVYRKARYLRMSDRAFHDAVIAALDRVTFLIEIYERERTGSPRGHVQR